MVDWATTILWLGAGGHLSDVVISKVLHRFKLFVDQLQSKVAKVK